MEKTQTYIPYRHPEPPAEVRYLDLPNRPEKKKNSFWGSVRLDVSGLDSNVFQGLQP